MVAINYAIDFLFFFDIILNFRTSTQDRNGEEVISPKVIAINYVTEGRFWIDVLSTIPFELIMAKIFDIADAQKFQILSMLKLFRVLRLGRIIAYMNSTNDVKLSLRLFKLFFFLVLYIHCTACLLYYVARFDESYPWIPAYNSYYAVDKPFEQESLGWKYILTFYYSILSLTGNDIYPRSTYQVILSCCLLISGALINANIFGTIAVILQMFNIKSQRLQEQIDLANTSMKNMKMPERLQENIREFMMSTQSNLDN